MTDNTIILNGKKVSFTPGETNYEIAAREETFIPTLCYDPRLISFGASRLCVVDIKGMKNPVASCTTAATAGMDVSTSNESIEKFRKTLLEMVVAENRELEVTPLRSIASQELTLLVEKYDAHNGRFQGAQSGHSKLDDNNPFLLRDYDLCISCYRCVRVCAEQEGDYAISVMNRGRPGPATKP